MIGYIRIRFLQSKSGNPMILIPFVVVHSNIHHSPSFSTVTHGGDHPKQYYRLVYFHSTVDKSGTGADMLLQRGTKQN